jgi:hypothetical protein
VNERAQQNKAAKRSRKKRDETTTQVRNSSTIYFVIQQCINFSSTYLTRTMFVTGS